MSTLREQIARIIRGWDKPIGRIGPGTERVIVEADAKADAILALLPLQPEGEVLTAEERRVLDTFTFGESRPGEEQE